MIVERERDWGKLRCLVKGDGGGRAMTLRNF